MAGATEKETRDAIRLSAPGFSLANQINAPSRATAAITPNSQIGSVRTGAVFTARGRPRRLRFASENRQSSGTFAFGRGLISQKPRNAAHREPTLMHGLIYLIGLIVVIMAVLSLLGLR
jgi:hypothetical protein